MNEHLTHQQLESFGNGTGSPGELLRMDRHLAGCSQCRSRIPLDSRLADSLSVLKDGDADADHLSYELIEAYVQSQVDDIDREIVTSHTAFCSECAERVQGLQGFVTTLSTPAREINTAAASPEPLSLWRRISATLKAPRWSYAIVGAAAAVLVLGVMLQQQGFRMGLGGSQTSKLLRGDSDVVERASLMPALLSEVTNGPSPNPGALVPNRAVVRTQRPTFRWKPMTGANSYRVEILNGAGSMMSDFVPGADWTPDFDLERGVVYSWSVFGYKDGQPLSSAAGSVETARFGIVSEEDERILSDALARYPESHLQLASAYLEAGLIDDAELELSRVDSSESDPAKTLRARIDRIRQATR